MTLNPALNTTYLSNNPCFPGQLFHVTGVEEAERFGKTSVLVTYERWAFPLSAEAPYYIETTRSWLVSNGSSFLKEQLPEQPQANFSAVRKIQIDNNLVKLK